MTELKKAVWAARSVLLILTVTAIMCIWGALYSSTLIGNPDISTVFAYPIVFYQLHNLSYAVVYVALAWISATFLFGKWLRKTYVTQASAVTFAGLILAIIATCAYENTALKMSWLTLFFEVLSACAMFYLIGRFDNKFAKRLSNSMWDFAFISTKDVNSVEKEKKSASMTSPSETVSEKESSLSDNIPKPEVLDDSVDTYSKPYKENKVDTPTRSVVVGPTTEESSVQEDAHQPADNPFDTDPNLDLSRLQNPYDEDDNDSVEVVNEIPHDYGESDVSSSVVSASESEENETVETPIEDEVAESFTVNEYTEDPVVTEDVETSAADEYVDNSVVNEDVEAPIENETRESSAVDEGQEIERRKDVVVNDSFDNDLDFGPDPIVENNNSDESIKNKALTFVEKVADKVSERAENMKSDSPKDGSK